MLLASDQCCIEHLRSRRLAVDRSPPGGVCHDEVRQRDIDMSLVLGTKGWRCKYRDFQSCATLFAAEQPKSWCDNCALAGRTLPATDTPLLCG